MDHLYSSAKSMENHNKHETVEGASNPDNKFASDRTLAHLMTRNIVTVVGEDNVSKAVQIMSQRNIGCVLVVKDGFVEGILTETDLLKNVAKGMNKDIKVKEVMSTPVVTAQSTMSMIEAAELMNVHRFRRLPVVENGRLVGIVTETDLTRAMTSSTVWKKIAENMSTEVQTASKTDSLVDIAEKMMVNNVGSIVVTNNNRNVLGVITEKDILMKVLAKGKNPEKIKVSEVMSSPAVTVTPDLSIYTAAKLMEENGFRRLPVTEKGILVGIVTQTDLSNAMKFFILDVEPRLEAKLKSTPIKYNLGKGTSYLIEEKSPLKSFEIFEDIVKHGSMGLCICRTNPNKIRDTYSLTTTPVVWVTDIKTGEKSIHPNDLTGLAAMAAKYVRSAKDSIVFLEALTYLINHNEFNTVLQMIQHIKDTISDANSTFIVSVDPAILSQRELRLLMQEMDEIKFIL